MQQRKVQIPAQRMEFSIKKNSARRDETGHLLVDVIWSTGASVVRYPMWDEPYLEVLSMDPEHVDLTRLNSGAAVLDNHKAYDLKDQIGTVVRDSAKIEDGLGVATLRMSKREEIKGIVEDIENDIITKISIGYLIRMFEETLPSEEGQMRTLTAKDWMPFEISFVCIPADDGAEARSSVENESNNQETFECIIISQKRSETMSEKTQTVEPTPEVRTQPVVQAPEVDTAKIKEEAKRELLAFQNDVRSLVKSAGLKSETAEEFLGRELSIEDVKSEIIKTLAKKDEEKPTRAANSIQITRDEVETRRESIESALMNRIDGKTELVKNARQFRGLTLVEISRNLLGDKAVGMNAREVASRALHHTSDLPHVLSNIANKTLRAGYESAPRTFLPLARQTFHNDFKGVERVQLEDKLSLDKIIEGGVIKHGTLGDSKESYKLVSYGKQVAVTREMIINDDMDAISRVPRMFGRNAADLESEMFWAEFQGGIMADGKAIYHADHNNLASGAALSETTLDGLEQLLAEQKKLNGQYMNILGRFLIVPRSLRNKAKQLVASVDASSTSEVNVYENEFDIISEIRLAGNAFYMAADYNQIDTFEVAYLAGSQGVEIEQEMDFDTRGIKISAVHDFGAKCIDYRGIAKNPGA